MVILHICKSNHLDLYIALTANGQPPMEIDQVVEYGKQNNGPLNKNAQFTFQFCKNENSDCSKNLTIMLISHIKGQLDFKCRPFHMGAFCAGFLFKIYLECFRMAIAAQS